MKDLGVQNGAASEFALGILGAGLGLDPSPGLNGSHWNPGDP